jgi:hypothetical protein
VDTVPAAIGLAVLALLVMGALALQSYGFSGRLQRRKLVQG